MDQDGLFCGEMSVEDAVEDSTPFCTLSGEVPSKCPEVLRPFGLSVLPECIS